MEAVKAGRQREALEPDTQAPLCGVQCGEALGDVELALELVEAAAAVVGAAQLGALAGVAGDLPDVVEQPRGDELNVALGAFALEEVMQVVVAVALGGHRPELADDGGLGKRAKLVHLDRGEETPRAGRSAAKMFVFS